MRSGALSSAFQWRPVCWRNGFVIFATLAAIRASRAARLLSRFSVHDLRLPRILVGVSVARFMLQP